MIPLRDAQAEVLRACAPLAPRDIAVADALGLVLAEAVRADEPVPPFTNTAMDGFAVRAVDVEDASEDHPIALKVIGTRGAGRPEAAEVGTGEALRIMTGAVFPAGADAVAIVETTRSEGDLVWVSAPATAGNHIRAPGEDLKAGQEVFAQGTLVGPGHVGVLCSIGRENVGVFPAPVVGVLSTGDELVEIGEALLPGQIRDSNRRTLISLLRRDGFVPVDLGIARDDEADIEARLRQGVAGCDAVLTSGGVSMGQFDYVKAVLDRIGEMHWMQVAIRPAKPFAFGTVDAKPVFGLPGNPVSSMVSYELLARPGLRLMAGHPDAALQRTRVRGVVDDPEWRGSKDGRVSFVRVQASFRNDGRCHVTSAGGQGSHQLHAMAVADGLAVVEARATVPAGAEVEVILFALP